MYITCEKNQGVLINTDNIIGIYQDFQYNRIYFRNKEYETFFRYDTKEEMIDKYRMLSNLLNTVKI